MRLTPLEVAQEKGRQAFREGIPRTHNPYPDKRTHSGRVSWSRSFRRAWWYGWAQESRGLNY